MEEEISSIERKKSSSGRVSYGQAVILHESKEKRVEIFPLFIPHSQYTELTIKISWCKPKGDTGWYDVWHEPLNLDGRATEKLLHTLQEHLAVAEQKNDGEYLLIKVSEGTADLKKHSPQMVAKALAKLLSREDIVQHLKNDDFSDQFLDSVKGAIRLHERKEVIRELEQNLAQGKAEEFVYQNWCERHSWAFGNVYIANDKLCKIFSEFVISVRGCPQSAIHAALEHLQFLLICFYVIASKAKQSSLSL